MIPKGKDETLKDDEEKEIYFIALKPIEKDKKESINFNIIDKSGSLFSYQETKLGQGKNTLIDLLKDNPELMEEIENQVIGQMNYKEENKLDELFNLL